jgi:hypothetical protein
MNERTKELTLQARKYARDYVAECKHYGHYMEQNEYELRFEEKFALLIVRECVEINKQELAFNAFERLMNRYKDHFGVEE